MSEIERITSKENRRLVNARNVRDGRVKAQIFVEGRRLVTEVLRSDLVINECFVSEDFRDENLVATLRLCTDKVIEISTKLFSTIADTDQSQGILVLVDRPVTGQLRIEQTLNSNSVRLVVFLKEINNPSNLGAILRSAEAAGVAGIVISTNSADPFSAKALRSAMGSGFRLPVWENVAFDEALAWASIRKLIPTAADISQDRSYTESDWSLPRLLILGSEAHGLTNAELGMIQEKVKIPMQNGVESLNLAVSAAVLMFEAQRQIQTSQP